ncbi:MULTISPECIES: SipW-dependent-type signal peptide-containing protein [unclassified Rhodococcus (in: high G+C Gram-positive bacteria)]|uniref:SipW-dependent-type signal peptide-containing protein n=1 Tax=Rhodococcus sp. SJ-3 TaxID=3454628 RepID=UPI003F79629C
MVDNPSAATRVRHTYRNLSAAFTVRVRAILSLGMILGLGSVGTFALWANSAVATSGTFSTGIVDLRVGDAKTYTVNDLALSAMVPGESRAAMMQVQNTRSTMDVTYTMAASTPAGSSALSDHLEIRVFSGGTASNSTANGMRAGTCTGTRIGSATLRAGSPIALITTARPLAAQSGIETLCVTAGLPPNASMTAQNRTVPTIVFTFNAQTTM